MALLLLVAGHPVGAALGIEAPSRVVAIGDIHGDYEAFVGILQAARLVDQERRWIGGEATLVQTGDFTDRGARVRDVMDLLMALQPQAKAAGGDVIALLGNHEAMNLLGEVRDATPAIYATFADEGSEARRAEAYAKYVELCRRMEATWTLESSRMADAALQQGQQPVIKPLPPVYQIVDEAAWMASHPPGFVEYRAAFGPDGRYGRWLRERPTVARLGNTIFLHGGIHPEVGRKKIDDINKRIAEEMKAFDAAWSHLLDEGRILPFFVLGEALDAARAEAVLMAQTEQGMRQIRRLVGILDIGRSWLLAPDGPLWFRGFAMWSPEEGAPLVADMLERYRAKHFVVGHTIPSSMTIRARFGQRVFLIDTGMLASHYAGGRASALELQDDTFTAIYPEGRVMLRDADEKEGVDR